MNSMAIKCERIEVSENTDGHLVELWEETLTDGSFIYNVSIENIDNKIFLNCRDKKHSERVFETLAMEGKKGEKLGRFWRDGNVANFQYGPHMTTVENSGRLNGEKKWQVATYKNGKRDGFRKQTYRTERAATIAALERVGLLRR